MASAFLGIDDLASGGVWIDKVNMGGTNATAGATGFQCHRSVNTDAHCTDTFLSNLDIFETSSTNPVVINSADGIWMSNSHFGRGSDADILIQPLFANEEIASIFADNLHLDGGLYGVHFVGIGSPTGVRANITLNNVSISAETADGIRVDDAAVNMLNITGCNTFSNAHAGINIQAGSNITITGCTFMGNNTANNGSIDLVIGGTSSHVVTSNMTFGAFQGYSGASHVSIADGADYVIHGANDYSGALNPNDISNSTSGTHIAIGPRGVTDKAIPISLPAQQTITAASGTITQSAAATYLSLDLFGSGGPGGAGMVCGGTLNCSGGSGGGGGAQLHLSRLSWAGLGFTGCTVTVGQPVAPGSTASVTQVTCGAFNFFAYGGGAGQNAASAANSGGGGGGSVLGAGAAGSGGTGGGGSGGASSGGSGTFGNTATNGMGSGGGGGANGAVGPVGGDAVTGSTGGGAGGGCTGGTVRAGGSSGSNAQGHANADTNGQSIIGSASTGGGGGSASTTTAGTGGNGGTPGGGGGGGGDVCAASGTPGTGGTSGGGEVVATQG